MKPIIVPFDGIYLEDAVNIENASFADAWSKSALESSAKMPLNGFYMALDENRRLCGYIIFMCLSPECEILNIAVSPECRRQGIADALISHACGIAREKKCETLMLEVRESNLPARLLYEKHGFHIVGYRRAYYKNPTEDAVLMDKIL